MSLVIATVPVPDLVESAWLGAVTGTVGREDRAAGAVYTPAEVIVPSVTFPPGTPLTLQVTAVSVVFVTVATNVTWFPRTTDPFVGVTVTTMDGGGGGGGAPPAPQPTVHTHRLGSRTTTIVVVVE